MKPNWSPPWFSEGYQKNMFVDFSSEYTYPPIRVHYWVWSNEYDLKT